MKENKKCNSGGLWIGGCVTALYYLVGLVFYVVFFFSKIGSGDWLTTFFLIYGLVGLVCVFPVFMLVVMKASVYTEYIDNIHDYDDCGCGCGCNYHEEEEPSKKQTLKTKTRKEKENE